MSTKWLNGIVIGVLMVFLLSACTEAEIEKVDKPQQTTAVEPNETQNNAPGTAAAETTAAEQPSEEASAETFKIGDSVKFDDLVITVNGIRESNGSDFFKPAEGNVYLYVDVTAENNGKEDAIISSMIQTEVADSEGYTYNVTIGDETKGSFDGAVGAGRKLRGEVTYEVPANASLEFIFSEPFKSGQAIWKIK